MSKIQFNPLVFGLSDALLAKDISEITTMHLLSLSLLLTFSANNFSTPIQTTVLPENTPNILSITSFQSQFLGKIKVPSFDNNFAYLNNSDKILAFENQRTQVKNSNYKATLGQKTLDKIQQLANSLERKFQNSNSKISQKTGNSTGNTDGNANQTSDAIFDKKLFLGPKNENTNSLFQPQIQNSISLNSSNNFTNFPSFASSEDSQNQNNKQNDQNNQNDQHSTENKNTESLAKETINWSLTSNLTSVLSPTISPSRRVSQSIPRSIQPNLSIPKSTKKIKIIERPIPQNLPQNLPAKTLKISDFNPNLPVEKVENNQNVEIPNPNIQKVQSLTIPSLPPSEPIMENIKIVDSIPNPAIPTNSNTTNSNNSTDFTNSTDSTNFQPITKTPELIPKKSIPIPLPKKVATNLDQMIIEKCQKYGCDANKMLKVVKCESGGRNVTGSGGHIGPFQFTNRTFYAFASKYGVQNADIWNMEHQAEVATRMFAQGLGKQHWSCY